MIENLGIIIQARTSSTRLPKKIILKVDEDMTFLDVLLSRFSQLKSKLPVILATSNLDVDKVLSSFAKKHGVEFYRGSEQNVLERFIECAENYKIKTIIRICSDNPFVDVKLIEKLIEKYNNEDYLSYQINKKPSILTHYGFFTEIVSLKALKQVYKFKKNQCIEHVTNCVYSNPEIFNVKFLEERIENNGIRCTLDTKDDFNILSDVYMNFVKKNRNCNHFEIINYIESRTDLLIKMNEIIKENKK